MSAETQPALTLEQMQARVREIIKKPEPTSKEFQELIYHVWDLVPVADDIKDKYSGTLNLPDNENPEVSIQVYDNKGEVNDLLFRPEDSGEYVDPIGEVVYVERFISEGGRPHITMGPFLQYRSTVLGKRIYLRPDRVESDGELLPKDLHKLSIKVFNAYQLGADRRYGSDIEFIH